MSAFGLKGGVGTASRLAAGDHGESVVGVLVVSNLGRLHELVVAGRAVGATLAAERGQTHTTPVGGSIIIIVATDAPVCSRQLKRLLRRAQNGLARTGSVTAHGSGEIVIGFTTAARLLHFGDHRSQQIVVLREESKCFDLLFQAVTEATEEAVLNSLFNAQTVAGFNGALYEGFPIERLEELMGGAVNP
jgi:D-aminopeptidase